MLKNKWFYSSIFIILFPIFLFVNLQNNTENLSNQSTNLDEVSNQEMEKVIELNPDIMPMRIALANRYFEAYDYSSALPHFMYVAENSNDIDLKSLSLSQIGWMVYESGDINTSLNYINEALRISPKSLLAETYKGIILIQQIDTRDEGILILNSRELLELFDLKIFIDIPEEIRLERRMNRDVNERNRTKEGIHNQWNMQVLPMHKKFVKNTINLADIIISKEDDFDELANQIVKKIEKS